MKSIYLHAGSPNRAVVLTVNEVKPQYLIINIYK